MSEPEVLIFPNADALAKAAARLIVDLANAADRDRFFTVLEKATATLETNLGTKFNATTLGQL